jgi:hypothetical protein
LKLRITGESLNGSEMVVGILTIAELSDRVVLGIGQQQHQLPRTMGIVGIGMIDCHCEPH